MVRVSLKFIPPVLAAVALAASIATPANAAAQRSLTEMLIVLGTGASDTANVEYVRDAADRTVPELPVVYEDEAGGHSPD